MRSLSTLARRVAVAGLVGGVAIVATAFPAYAPHVAQMQVTPSTAKPGEQVTVFGPRGYGVANPVQVRWENVDGPVLGEYKTRETGFAMWGPETITIPADAKPGIHHLWVTQKLEPNETIQRGLPVQTVIQVSDANGAVPVVAQPLTETEARPGALLADESASGGSLLLVALGAAGAALFLSGVAAVAASRSRSRSPESAVAVKA